MRYGAYGQDDELELVELAESGGPRGLGQYTPGSVAPTVELALEYDPTPAANGAVPPPEFGQVRTAAIPAWLLLLAGTAWVINRYYGGGR